MNQANEKKIRLDKETLKENIYKALYQGDTLKNFENEIAHTYMYVSYLPKNVFYNNGDPSELMRNLAVGLENKFAEGLINNIVNILWGEPENK